MQRRYWNFLDDDATKDINRWLTGLLLPGLYRGFDFNPTANLNLNLNHNTTGFKDVSDTEVESAFTGLIVTRQGTVIKQDNDITINGIGAGDATHPRIDLIVITHDYISTAGGATALYSVIPGTPAASPVAPALTNPLTQIALGQLYIPASTSALNEPGVIYTRSDKPEFANGGLIGSRIYTDQNILSNRETITQSLDRLDRAFGNFSTSATDLDIFTSPGFHHINNAVLNGPTGMSSTCQLFISGDRDNTVVQRVVDLTNQAEWLRALAGGVWSAWSIIKNAQYTFPIGAWDMQAGGNRQFGHGLGASLPRLLVSMSVQVLNNGESISRPLDYLLTATDTEPGGWFEVDATNIILGVNVGGGYEGNAAYGGTGLANRGWVKIEKRPS